MSVQRAELLRLVEELPEEEVVLDDVRRHLRSVRERPWPPAWDFTPADLTNADCARMADLVNTYESLPQGTTDASVVEGYPETSAGQTGCTNRPGSPQQPRAVRCVASGRCVSSDGRHGRLSFVPPNRSAPVSLLAEDRADALEFRINGKHGDQVRPPCGTFVPTGRAGLLVR